MMIRWLAPLRSLVLSAGMLLWVVLPGAAGPAGAEDGEEPGRPPEPDLATKIERLLDARTAAVRVGLHEAIATEIERHERRMALAPAAREAADRTLRELATRATAEGALIDGRTGEIRTMREAVDRIESARMIYVAENHDNPAHHEIQLRVIRAAFRSNPKLLIGMEMFERGAQKHLDDYTQGRIDESTFLERIDWKKSWGFDYALYQPILDFARQMKLKVVGLNAPRGIVRKVGKDGLAALVEEDRKQIARDIDTQDPGHRRQFMKVLDMHGTGGGHAPNPEHYYEAMCVWDETMAETAARYMRAPKNSGASMVVLAGSGHIAYRFGIPARVQRRLHLPDLTVIPLALPADQPEGTVEEALLRPPGDFVVLTKDVDRTHPRDR